eukprot:scaffold23428_cov86-Isochrysis_galbana.AAC.3
MPCDVPFRACHVLVFWRVPPPHLCRVAEPFAVIASRLRRRGAPRAVDGARARFEEGRLVEGREDRAHVDVPQGRELHAQAGGEASHRVLGGGVRRQERDSHLVSQRGRQVEDVGRARCGFGPRPHGRHRCPMPQARAGSV